MRFLSPFSSQFVISVFHVCEQTLLASNMSDRVKFSHYVDVLIQLHELLNPI